jgi:hypothetical protein
MYLCIDSERSAIERGELCSPVQSFRVTSQKSRKGYVGMYQSEGNDDSNFETILKPARLHFFESAQLHLHHTS